MDFLVHLSISISLQFPFHLLSSFLFSLYCLFFFILSLLLVLSCLFFSCLVLSCLVSSCLVLSCLVLFCLVSLSLSSLSLSSFLSSFSVSLCLSLCLSLSLTHSLSLSHSLTVSRHPHNKPRNEDGGKSAWAPILYTARAKRCEPYLATTAPTQSLNAKYIASIATGNDAPHAKRHPWAFGVLSPRSWSKPASRGSRGNPTLSQA